MAHSRCRFCDYSGAPSPGAPEFCKACGSPFRLAPCPNCAAVNELTAAECYKCHCKLAFAADPVEPEVIPAGLVESASAPVNEAVSESFVDSARNGAAAAAKTGVYFPSLASIKTIEPSSIVPEVRFNKTAGTILVLVIVVAGLVGYRRYTTPDAVNQPESAAINAGTIQKTMPTVPPTPPNPTAVAPAAPAALALPSPVTVSNDSAASKTNGRSAVAETPAESAANAETSQVAAQKSGRSNESRERRRNRQTSTGVAADDSALTPRQSNAQSSPPTTASTTRPTPPPVRPCTEAVAALGLCSLESTPRK